MVADAVGSRRAIVAVQHASIVRATKISDAVQRVADYRRPDVWVGAVRSPSTKMMQDGKVAPRRGNLEERSHVRQATVSGHAGDHTVRYAEAVKQIFTVRGSRQCLDDPKFTSVRPNGKYGAGTRAAAGAGIAVPCGAPVKPACLGDNGAEGNRRSLCIRERMNDLEPIVRGVDRERPRGSHDQRRKPGSTTVCL